MPDIWVPSGTVYYPCPDGVWRSPGWPDLLPGQNPNSPTPIDPTQPSTPARIRHVRLRGQTLLVTEPVDPDPVDPGANLNPRPAKGTPGTIQYEEVYQSGQTVQQVLNAASLRAPNLSTQIILTFPPGEFTFRDFSQANIYGLRSPVNVGIWGSGNVGADATVFKMVEGSSTKGPSVPQPGSGATNQFSVFGIQNTGGASNIDPPRGITFKSFAVIGTWQPPSPTVTKAADPKGHLYNGLRFQNTNGLILEDVYFEGWPGNQAAPPGETFGLNIYKGSAARLLRVEINGMRSRQGENTKIGSSPIGFNSHSDARVVDCYFHDGPYGMPTSYLSHRIYWLRTRSENNRTGFNNERVELATYESCSSYPLLTDTGYPLPSGDPAKPGNYNWTLMNDGIEGPADGQLKIIDPRFGVTRNSRPGSAHEGEVVIYQGSRGTDDTQKTAPDVRTLAGAVMSNVYHIKGTV